MTIHISFFGIPTVRQRRSKTEEIFLKVPKYSSGNLDTVSAKALRRSIWLELEPLSGSHNRLFISPRHVSREGLCLIDGPF